MQSNCLCAPNHCGQGRQWHTLSSASRGKCRRISIGSVSAAKTTNEAIPRFKVFVAAFAYVVARHCARLSMAGDYATQSRHCT